MKATRALLLPAGLLLVRAAPLPGGWWWSVLVAGACFCWCWRASPPPSSPEAQEQAQERVGWAGGGVLHHQPGRCSPEPLGAHSGLLVEEVVEGRRVLDAPPQGHSALPRRVDNSQPRHLVKVESLYAENAYGTTGLEIQPIDLTYFPDTL